MSNLGSTWLILIFILVLMSPMKTHQFLILLLSSLCCHTAKVWSSRQSAPSGGIDCCPQVSKPPFEKIIMLLLGPKSPASLGRHHSLDQALSAGNDQEEFLCYVSPKTYCFQLHQMCRVHGYARSLRMEQRSIPWGAPPIYAGAMMPENDQAQR